MGLKLTLEKSHNHMAIDFVDAYWAIGNISYSTNTCEFELKAYPSREVKLIDGQELAEPSIGIGTALHGGIIDCSVYIWHAISDLSVIFPNGVPLSVDEQKRAIYTYIKEYAQLPFEDVIEGA